MPRTDEGLVLQRRRRRGGDQALALGLGQREPLGLRMALLLEPLAGRMVVLPRPRWAATLLQVKKKVPQNQQKIGKIRRIQELRNWVERLGLPGGAWRLVARPFEWWI